MRLMGRAHTEPGDFIRKVIAKQFQTVFLRFKSAFQKVLPHLPPEELSEVPTVCGSLREALESLDADRDFLKKGGVMDDDMIDGYLDLKWEEVYNFEHAPHPVEFKMYYSC